MESRSNNFPKDFFWGASTASHQVEGGNHNQWTVWELAHAKELAQTAHQRLSWIPMWDDIKAQAEDPDNYVSGRGVEHFTRYKEDFKLVKQLNLNSFRFSLEWSRIEPKEGQWNQEAIDYYKNYIAELRAQGIEPFLNLWHYTLPVWFDKKGGFSRRKNLAYFERFVQKVADELIDDVVYIITVNEPNVYSTFSYLIGEWPPQEKNLIKCAKVYWNIARAHKKAYKILKEKKPIAHVGVAAQLGNIQAKRPHNITDSISTKVMRYVWNWWFLRRIRKHQDFIGINYYYTDYYTGVGKKKNPRTPLSDVGAYMEPEGLYPLLLRTWTRYKKPIFITENGLPDADDMYRRWWIEESIVAMEKAISEGVDLRGYMHWGLLDNFEWAFGWWPKYGLVEVDRQNGMKRTIRPSAKWFAERIELLS